MANILDQYLFQYLIYLFITQFTHDILRTRKNNLIKIILFFIKFYKVL